MPNRSRWHARVTAVTLRYPSGGFMLLEPTEGNISVGPMNADNFEDIQVRNRTKHDGHVEGPDLVQDVSMTLEMERATLTEAVSKRILDAFLKTGSFAAETSVDAIIKGSWILDVDFDDGAGLTGQLQLPETTGDVTFAVGAETNTISLSGRNFVKPVIT